MARTRNQVTGDQGELRVVERLLKLGAAVNSLTASDHGWDIHAQLPAAIVDLGATEGPAVWELSGTAVHVQVKATRSKTSPTLKVKLVETWLKGAALGTTTIVAQVIFSVGDSTTERYALPDALWTWWEGHRNSATATLSSTYFVEFGSNIELARVLHLLARFPALASRLPLTELVHAGQGATFDPAPLLEQLAGAYLRWHATSDIDRQVRDVVEALVSAFHETDGVDELVLINEVTAIVSNVKGTVYHGEFMDSEIPLGAITLEQDQRKALQDLVALAQILGSLRSL